jgi:hypothetical protein
MAPQAIEIAQNGLGDPPLAVVGRRLDQGTAQRSIPR